MPSRAKRPCRSAGCPALVDTGYCDRHRDQAKSYDQWRGTASSRGYDAAWVKIRDAALKRDCYLCRHCLARGRVVPATEVDHIVSVAIAPERRLDLTNTQSLCHSCHVTKTHRERR